MANPKKSAMSERIGVCLLISSGLRPVEPAVPAIHPTGKLIGILANEIKTSIAFVYTMDAWFK